MDPCSVPIYYIKQCSVSKLHCMFTRNGSLLFCFQIFICLMGKGKSFRGISKWHKWNKRVHDDVIKWKHFPRNWPFVREIHRSPVNFPHKGQWRGALMFSLIYAWINDWVNNREAGDLRRQHGHYDVIVMLHVTHVSVTVDPLGSGSSGSFSQTLDGAKT